MRALTLVAILITLTACGPVKESPPATFTKTEVIEIPVKVYVPIDKKRTERCAWVKDGEIADIFEVSRGRKKCLERYEINLDAIEQVQGTPVPEAQP